MVSYATTAVVLLAMAINRGYGPGFDLSQKNCLPRISSVDKPGRLVGRRLDDKPDKKMWKV